MYIMKTVFNRIPLNSNSYYDWPLTINSGNWVAGQDGATHIFDCQRCIALVLKLHVGIV